MVIKGSQQDYVLVAPFYFNTYLKFLLMCLNCSIKLNKSIMPWDKQEIDKMLSIKWNTVYIHTHANTVFPLAQLEIEEIKDNALALIAMGVEGGLLFIWAIQWPSHYKPIYFKI